MNGTQRQLKISLLLILLAAFAVSPVRAQGGSFFNNPGSPTAPGALGTNESEPDGPPSSKKEKAAPGQLSPNGGDYTEDEKRMQRKYKFNVRHAKDLIAKGEDMMKSAHGNVNNKDYKKGKILKEIGEKSLSELDANNPFPPSEKDKEKASKEGKPVKDGKSAAPRQEL